MNPLEQYPEARKYLYMLQWVVNAVVTIAGAYFLVDGTSMDDLPQWYVLTVGIAPVLWTVLGITAQTNVNTPQEPLPEPLEPLPEPKDPNEPMYPKTPEPPPAGGV
jgi:uncharacterized membrane protein YhdT